MDRYAWALLIFSVGAFLIGTSLGIAVGSVLPRDSIVAATYQPKTYLDVHDRSSLMFQRAAQKDGAEDVAHCIDVCLCLHRNRGCGPLGIPED